MRDEVQKHGSAIQKANERKATVQGACKLFKNFLDADARFIKSLEENSRTCGVPGDAIKQAKEGALQGYGHWQAGLRCGGPGS